MKKLLSIEGLFYFLLAMFLFTALDFNWRWYLALFFLPDISMIGYLVNAKTGAFAYNAIHHKGVAIGMYIIGAYLGNQAIQLAGLVLLGHSSLDRVLGYGLKYPDSFKHTHLGAMR